MDGPLDGFGHRDSASYPDTESQFDKKVIPSKYRSLSGG